MTEPSGPRGDESAEFTTREAQALVLMLANAISLEPRQRLERVDCGGLDWLRFQMLATRNRVANWVPQTLCANMPAAIARSFTDYKSMTAVWNATGLAGVRRLAPAFAAADLDYAIMKGPLQQKMLFGDFFIKPATDIDIIVTPENFERASGIVADSGWRLDETCRSPWWTVFLGEQHFKHNKRAHEAAVDLHFKIIQPGCPGLDAPLLLLKETANCEVGSTFVRTLNRTATGVMCVLGFVKALAHRDPGLPYLVDLAKVFWILSKDEASTLNQLASALHLKKALAFCVDATRVLGFAPPQLAIEGSSFGVAPSQLLSLLLDPESAAFPRRSTMLWRLLDRRTDMPGKLAWTAAAEVVRVFTEPASNRVPAAMVI